MFEHITGKILSRVAVALLLGLGVLTYFYTQAQERTLLQQHDRVMAKLKESVTQGLNTIMVAGYADVSHAFAENLKQVSDFADFRVLRTDGTEAFQDNDTINTVNRILGEAAFAQRPDETLVTVLPHNHLQLRQAINEARTVRVREVHSDGQNYLTYLAPILNRPECFPCHGSDHAVRGVLKLTSSMAELERDIQLTRRRAVELLALAVVVILTITWLALTRFVTRPIRRVTSAMGQSTQTLLNDPIAAVGEDEVRQMIDSFNVMIRRLNQSYLGLINERNKLTTVLQGTSDGVVVSDSIGRVVSANPAALVYLGRGLDELRRRGFLRLFEDEGLMRRLMAQSFRKGAEPALFHFNQRILSVLVSTIRVADGKVVGTAVMIRDMTEQQRLQERLQRLSITDPLTGLYNRRFLDIHLAEELQRARRYRLPLALLVFDIDRFKLFNDTHGHERGDRVLIAMGDYLRRATRAIDIPCRYGGEEFVMVLPNTTLEFARGIATRLCQDIREMDIEGLGVTISVGVAGVPSLALESAEELFQAADEALYQAKAAGRDCVKVAEGHMQVSV